MAQIEPETDECLLRFALAVKPYHAQSGRCLARWERVARALARERNAPGRYTAMRAMRRFRFLCRVFAHSDHALHAQLTPALYAMLAQIDEDVEPLRTPSGEATQEQRAYEDALAPEHEEARDEVKVPAHGQQESNQDHGLEEQGDHTIDTATGSSSTDLVVTGAVGIASPALERVNRFLLEQTQHDFERQRATCELQLDLAALDKTALQRENEHLRRLLVAQTNNAQAQAGTPNTALP